MRDVLLRQALESRKTVSKKKRTKEEMGSKDSSAANSRVNSRTPSRAVSTQGSDEDDDDNMSDDASNGTEMSAASLGFDITSNGSNEESEDEDSGLDWKQNLFERTEEIMDKKKSSLQGREKSYLGYINILRAHFAPKDITSNSRELVSAMMRSVKNENSEREVCLALKALEMTVITIDSDDIYDSVYEQLKNTYQDSQSETIKASAIYALGTCAVYGGASAEEYSEIMDELLEIIESDGNSVEAPDSVDVVVAALQTWGQLAIGAEDLEDKSEESIEVFREQFESSSAAVRISAGQNVALLFEKSYVEDDEEYDSEEEDEERRTRTENRLAGLKQYNPARNQYQLVQEIKDVIRESSKGIAKKDRTKVRAVFREVLTTVESPTRGPGYRTHYGQGGESALGGGIVVKIFRRGHFVIRRWWQFQKLEALKRVLRGGFMVHYEDNPVIFNNLPIIAVNPTPTTKSGRMRKFVYTDDQ